MIDMLIVWIIVLLIVSFLLALNSLRGELKRVKKQNAVDHANLGESEEKSHELFKEKEVILEHS